MALDKRRAQALAAFSSENFLPRAREAMQRALKPFRGRRRWRFFPSSPWLMVLRMKSVSGKILSSTQRAETKRANEKWLQIHPARVSEMICFVIFLYWKNNSIVVGAQREWVRESMKNAGRSAFWTFIEFIRRWRAEKDEVVYRRFISKTKGKTLEERKINWFFRLIILIHSMAANESEHTIHLKALERWFTCTAAMRNLFTFPSFSSIMLSATTAKKAKKNLAPAKTTAMTRNLFLWII